MMGKIAVFILCLAFAPRAFAVSVEQAYASLEHRRPIFNPSLSEQPMPVDEAACLIQLFGIIDETVVQRVETVSWLAGGGEGPGPFDGYDAVIFRLKALRAPEKLKPVHQLVVEAVEQQRDVLRLWRSQPRGFEWSLAKQHPLVAASSQKLHQAYEQVVRLYPGEHHKNRESFYSYFCCLDLI